MIVYLRNAKTHKNYWEAEIYSNDIHCGLYAKNYFDKLIDLFDELVNSSSGNHDEYDKWYNYIEYLEEYRREIFEWKLHGKSITTEEIIKVTLEDMKKVAEDLGLVVVTD